VNKKLRAEGKRDIIDIVIAKIKATSPKGEDKEAVEVTRTNRGILSKIKYVLKTGIDAIDDIVGGFPFGRVVELYGLESCGKTSIVIKSAIQTQLKEIYERINTDGKITLKKLDPDEYDVTTLYVDNEGSLDDDEKIVIGGVELDIALARCDVTIKAIDDHGKSIKRPQFIVIIVDTIAGTSSKEELKALWGTSDYPRQPKQLRQAFRKMIRQINKRNVCAIFTNQVSDSYKAKAMGRPQLTTPQDEDFSTFGGRALKFYASIRVFMFKIQTVYKLVHQAQFAAGYLIGFFTSKNRVVKPLRSGRAVILFDRGFDNTFSMLETLIFLRFAELPKQGKGKVIFKFKANGIETTTFGKDDVESDGEEVEGEAKGGNPLIKSRASWPSYYAKHKADFDIMWQRAIAYTFATEGLDQICRSTEDDIDDPETDEPGPARGTSVVDEDE
jgi:recombination protein RecA